MRHYEAIKQLGARLSAQRDANVGSTPTVQPVEATMNSRGSSRTWMRRLLGLAVVLTLCFTAITGTLQAQSDCAFADVNGDGVVDDADLLTVLFCFGVDTRQTIPDLNQAVRMRLPSAFPRNFPAAPEVPFDPQNAAFATTRLTTDLASDDVFVAWNTRADFYQFDVEQIASGLIVGAVYLPEGFAPTGEPTGEPIPEGFYLVRMHSPDTQNWQADLLDAFTGRTVAANLVAIASRTFRIRIPGTRNDIAIKVRPRPPFPIGYCSEIWLSFLCPNGLWLDYLVIWRRCFP